MTRQAPARPRPVGKPAPAPGRPRKVGDATVSGTVQGRPRNVRKRFTAKIVDRLLLGPFRRRMKRKIARTVDWLTLGPYLRRKEARRRAKAQKRGRRRGVRHADAGGPQVHPQCQDHVGKPPKSRPLRRNGQAKAGRGYCPSCKRELKLSRGRIPKHEPGPPPFTHCPITGDWLPAWYPQLRVERGGRGGSYTPCVAPRAERAQLREQQQRDGMEPTDITTEDLG